ncbi:hypothetical protein BGP_0424 [Beggiatoa sp. PS]|nr:hypothetical protein BGP_0424 [Beggiatoa sp. PS]
MFFPLKSVVPEENRYLHVNHHNKVGALIFHKNTNNKCPQTIPTHKGLFEDILVLPLLFSINYDEFYLLLKIT